MPSEDRSPGPLIRAAGVGSLALADEVLRAAQTRRPTLAGARLVAVDGLAGSGKSTLAAAIGVLRPDATVLATDEMLAGWRGLPGLGHTLEQLLRPVAAGAAGRWRRWDWIGGDWAEEHRLGPFAPRSASARATAPVVVLEGVGSAAAEIRDLVTLAVWLEADDEQRLARGLARDGEAMRAHWTTWMDDERRHHARRRTREAADLAYDTTTAAGDPPAAPTGTPHEIRGGDYRAVVTSGGACLRLLEHAGRPLVAPFAADAVPDRARGQVLAPWPNRLEDGRYAWHGIEHRVPVDEPSTGNALHGLVRWAAWEALTVADDLVVLRHRLVGRPGYPWRLELRVSYRLDEHGLRVRHEAAHLAPDSDDGPIPPAPWACGAHPYLRAGAAPYDAWELELPAATRLDRDDARLLPTAARDVASAGVDFRAPRALAGTGFDHAFTDLARGPDGRARVRLRAPAGSGVELWVDEAFGWLQVYAAGGDAEERDGIAVEPMTAPPNALATGRAVRPLAVGESASATWGIAAL